MGANMKVLLKLKPYLKPFLGLIVLTVVLAVPLAALRAAPVPLVKYLIDELLVNKDPSFLVLLPLALVGVAILNFVIRFLHYYLMRVVIIRTNQKIRNDMFSRIMGLSSDYFSAESTGTLMSRVGNDPLRIDNGISVINILAREPITLLFLLGYAAYLDWKLFLITLVVLPGLGWIFHFTGRNLKRYMHRMQEENAHSFSALQEGFSGIRVIKAFGLEGYMREKFESRISELKKFELKTSALEEAAHPGVEAVIYLSIAGVLYYGGQSVIDGTMTTGSLFAFFAAFGMSFDRIRQLNDINMKLHQASAAADRIFEVLSWESKIKETPHPKPLTDLRDGIEFDQVTFHYPEHPEREILNKISFKIKKGEVIAFVGESGAGKSSLVSLLPRLYDVSGGSIRIDGTDLQEFKIRDLRNQIAVVSQDVFLFNDTVAENIHCGRLGASREEIIEAAKRAHAMDFIQRLPHGLDTEIGDRGQKLSGGERQRLSIARAFLREAPILILDEATSNLDSASEKIVQKALEELMQNRTTLVIAHRLSTIRHADRIIVLKEGKIAESGKHEELLGLRGEYERFHSLHH